MIYSKITDVFKVKSTDIGTDLPIATPNVAKDNFISVNAIHEEITLTYVVRQNSPVASLDEIGSSKNIVSGLQDVFDFVKRQRLSQGLYRCT